MSENSTPKKIKKKIVTPEDHMNKDIRTPESGIIRNVHNPEEFMKQSIIERRRKSHESH